MAFRHQHSRDGVSAQQPPRRRPRAAFAAARRLAFAAARPAAILGAGLAAGMGLPFVQGAQASPPAASATTAHPAPAIAGPPVHNRELLVRFRATGELQRIKVGAGQDPLTLARALRRRTDLFSSVGANLIATAAGSTVAAEGAQATSPTTPIATTPAATTPVATTPSITVPRSATIRPPSDLAGWLPNDVVGGYPWTRLQWNFVGRYGVNATEAWDILRRRRLATSGGAGVTIAVIDSGLAYRARPTVAASPDIDPARVLPGYDFIDNDRYPDDDSGHGTHVASTIAAATDNAAGMTGLAYNAKIVPIRVLGDKDGGDVLTITRGIRYAIRRNVDLINLSVDFAPEVTAADIPELIDAVDDARRAGILVIASSGNDGERRVSYPARAASVLAVGAATYRGCRSSFSNSGDELALVAPGGWTDHASANDRRCDPRDPGPPIAQITVVKPAWKLPVGAPLTLGVPLNYFGTSMAAAHVTGIAALVLGSRIIGRHPTPELLAAYLVRATRDLGPAGRDNDYGAGLIDAKKAVSRSGAGIRVRGAKRAVATAARKHRRALPIR